jgi:hypothetical protein
MISYLDVFPLLVAACPSFQGSIHASRADEEDGEYLRVEHLVGHLIDLVTRDDTEEMPAVFAVVESVLDEGDEEARSLITEGFFDDLINVEFFGESPTQPRDFAPWLGPRARKHAAFRRFL